MIKNTVAALVSVVALAGVAMPTVAFAEPVPVEATQSFDADFVLFQLQSEGVNATSVEEWGSYLRAFVVGEDGHQAMKFFDPDTLAPVEL